MKEYPFGAAFFMPSEGIANDLVNMKATGMNVARLEWIKNAVWEAVEQSPDTYSFDVIDEAMEVAANTSIKVILQIGIHPPRWVRDAYGGVGVVNERGLIPHPREKFSICYDNPQIIQLAEKYIRTMVRRYKNHPALYGWISWNEPHLSSEDITCYCPHTMKAFRIWLQKKYGDLKTLNEAWMEGYPAYTSWDEVEPPRQMPRERGIYQAWQDWRNFMDENFSNLLKWVTSVIKEEDDYHPTKVNLLMPTLNTTIICSDVWKMADTADEIGVSLFVDTNEGDYPQLFSQSVDLVRSAIAYHDRSFWLDETQGGPNFVSHRYPVLPQDKKISLYPWQSIAHGAKGFTYWMWRPLAIGHEAGEFGLVGKDGSPRPRTAEAARAGAIIQKHADIILNSEPDNKVCIMHSQEIFHLTYGEGLDTHIKSFPLDNPPQKSRYTSALLGAYTMLWEEKFGVDFISPEHIENGGLEKYRALVMPFPYLMSEDTAIAVKNFVATGGLLISEFPNVMKDWGGKIYKITPGAGLRDMFGFEEIDFGPTDGRPIILSDGAKVTTGQMKQIVQVDSCCSIIGRFPDGSPAVIFNRYGQGGVLSFCTEVFQPVMWNNHDALASLTEKFLQIYRVTKAGELHGIEESLARRVEIAELTNPNGKLVIVINHNHQAISGSLYLNQGSKYINLENDEELILDRGKLFLNLEGFGVLALFCTA